MPARQGCWLHLQQPAGLQEQQTRLYWLLSASINEWLRELILTGRTHYKDQLLCSIGGFLCEVQSVYRMLHQRLG
jgi:hypothetical protein